MTDEKLREFVYYFNEGFTDVKQLEDQEKEIVENIKNFIRKKKETKNVRINKKKLEKCLDELLDFIPKRLTMDVYENKVVVECQYECYMEYVYQTCIKKKLDDMINEHKNYIKRYLVYIKNNYEKSSKTFTLFNFKNFIFDANIKHNYENTKYEYFFVNYIDVDTNTPIYCSTHGFSQQHPYVHLKGTGCSKCYGNIRYSTEYIKNYLDSVELDLLSEYKNGHTHIDVGCRKCSHVWPVRFSSLKCHKSGCPKCAGVLKYKTEQIREILGDNNFDFLDKEYINGKLPINVRCKTCLYEIPVSFSSFKQQGFSCPNCSGIIKYTTEKVVDILKSVNITFRSDKYENSKTYINVKCEICSHEWKVIFCAIAKRIREGRRGCPRCAKILKHTLEDVRKFLENIDLKLLSETYKSRKDHIHVMCDKCKYEWYPTFNDIKSGCGCPECNRGISKGEKSIKNFLNGKKYEFQIQKKYKLCKNIFTLPFDFFLPKYDFLVEYDGSQHFEFSSKFHRTDQIFELQQQKDRIKDLFAFDNNISLIRFSYKCKIEDIQEILQEHINKIENRKRTWCFYRFYITKNIIFVVNKSDTRMIIKFINRETSELTSVTKNIIKIYESAVKYILKNSKQTFSQKNVIDTNFSKIYNEKEILRISF